MPFGAGRVGRRLPDVSRRRKLCSWRLRRSGTQRSGDVHIAYSVLGDGPIDLVFAPGFISNVEYGWEELGLARFYFSLASFSRLIVFDKRGTGLSDAMVGGQPLETRMDDVRAVMDAATSERAAIVGYSEGGSMATLFAATHPERTVGLILYGALISGTWSPETPWAWRREQWDAWLNDVERRWGTAAYCEEQLRNDAPSKIGDAAFERWYATRLRLGASPGAAAAMVRTAGEIDLAHVLPTVRVPTLVLHRVGPGRRRAKCALRRRADSRRTLRRTSRR